MTASLTSDGTETAAEASLRIHVRFITNRCVAARVDAREQPEWPPHPGRFYMALAAAHFEADGPEHDKQTERLALEWLAKLPSPRIHAVAAEERTSVVYYVPVNDAPQPNKAMLQSAPGFPRSRQSRYFPTIIPQRLESSNEIESDVAYEWPNALGVSEHLPALECLCDRIIRVGHSSSLVMAWTETGDADALRDCDCWEPASSIAELTCRVAVAGELGRLQTAYRAERIDQFAALKNEIESTDGKAQATAKKRFAEAFGEPYKASVRPPEPAPATLSIWQGYRRAAADRNAVLSLHENSYFERDLIILTKHDGPALNVERTLGLTQALRAALLATHGNVTIPSWLSGHEPDGSPASSPHVAFLALPFAGFPHADGHVMGLAIALPKDVPVAQRGRWLAPLLVDQETGEPARQSLKLWGKDLPDWTLQLEERPSPPRMLQNSTWTKPSATWASVTPVVLDRFPKAPRTDERRAWQDEVAEIVKLACTRAGLPEPIEVDVDSTAWHLGIPRAWAKTRRAGNGRGLQHSAPLGDGFPLLQARPSRPSKPQVHVWLRFDHKVSGPVLIGAGRFAGYGLCLPVKHAKAGDLL